MEVSEVKADRRSRTWNTRGTAHGTPLAMRQACWQVRYAVIHGRSLTTLRDLFAILRKR